MTDAPLKLDLGCGPNKQSGFVGVDRLAFGGKVDVVHDLRETPWPWKDDSVDEVHCSHFLEHLTNLDGKWERVRFFNELGRILKPGAKAVIVIPHWCSTRYYGDPTHKEPFSEMGFFYLNREWRMVNAPHCDISNSPNGYSCDFDFGAGHTRHASLAVRNEEYVQFALANFKEAAQDLFSTITKRSPVAAEVS